MTARVYRVDVFKKIPGTGEVYGAKSFEGSLDRACKRLVKMFGRRAEVRVVGPGLYSVAGGQAELRVADQ